MKIEERTARFFERFPRLMEKESSRLAYSRSIERMSPYLDILEKALGVEMVTIYDAMGPYERGQFSVSELTPRTWPIVIELLEGPLDQKVFGELCNLFRYPEADAYWDRFEGLLARFPLEEPQRGSILNVLLDMSSKRTADKLLALAQNNTDDGSIVILFRKIKQLCGESGREFLESLIDHPTFHITARKVLRLPKLGS